MGTPALVGTVIGGTLGSSVLQARAAELEGQAVKAAADFNALLATQHGRAEAARLRRGARRTVSGQAVAFAAAGVELSGSPLERLAQNAAELEVNALNVEIAAANVAELERVRGRNALAAARVARGAALLSGVTRAAGFALNLRGTGGTGGSGSTSAPKGSVRTDVIRDPLLRGMA